MTNILVVDDLAMDRSTVGELLAEDDTLRISCALDGVDALEQLGRGDFDLVVTDLMMPRMDGLELVATARRRFPLVPMILMTSKGTEEIAVAALAQGAASYVPKRQLAEDLLRIVHRVLSVSGTQRGRSRLMGCLAESNSSFVLKNDCTLFEPLISYLQDALTQVGVCDDADCTRVGVALAEALANAMCHGNLEVASQIREQDGERYRAMLDQRAATPPWCERRIRVTASLSRHAAQFAVQDDGPGFNWRGLPDPTEPDNLEKATGRGILLMRTFMDEVDYNNVGNAVTMVKRRRA
jgi:CheY-like chemotaxis protein/anti-sigma regulatory factor (Ser/Thr protein kinase)